MHSAPPRFATLHLPLEALSSCGWMLLRVSLVIRVARDFGLSHFPPKIQGGGGWGGGGVSRVFTIYKSHKVRGPRDPQQVNTFGCTTPRLHTLHGCTRGCTLSVAHAAAPLHGCALSVVPCRLHTVSCTLSVAHTPRLHTLRGCTHSTVAHAVAHAAAPLHGCALSVVPCRLHTGGCTLAVAHTAAHCRLHTVSCTTPRLRTHSTLMHVAHPGCTPHTAIPVAYSRSHAHSGCTPPRSYRLHTPKAMTVAYSALMHVAHPACTPTVGGCLPSSWGRAATHVGRHATCL